MPRSLCSHLGSSCISGQTSQFLRTRSSHISHEAEPLGVSPHPGAPSVARPLQVKLTFKEGRLARPPWAIWLPLWLGPLPFSGLKTRGSQSLAHSVEWAVPDFFWESRGGATPPPPPTTTHQLEVRK